MMKSKRVAYTVVLSRDEDGAYLVSCPVFPGCHTHGRNRREALANVREAILANVAANLKLGLPVPCEEGTAEIAVEF